MVKKLLFLYLFMVTISFSQTFELGLGVRGNINWLKGNEDFLTETLDKAPYFDTVYFNFNETKMDISYSIPLFFRFRTKFGFWAEIAYATEKMTTNISGTSNYSNSYLDTYTANNMWNDYNNPNFSTNLTWNEFYASYYGDYYQKESDTWEEQVSYKEITKFNKLSLNFGYTFMRTKKVRPFVSLGFDWNSRTNKNHYQELQYETFWVNDYSTIYKKMPRLNSNLFFITVGAGIEVYNMQLGINLRQSVGFVQEYEFKEEVDLTDDTYTDLYKSITSFSFYLKYSLFNFNVKNSEDRKKLKNKELKVLGDFREKSKLVRLSIGIDLPFYTNINSLYDNTYPRDVLFQSAETPSMFMDEMVFISNYKKETAFNSSGQLETKEIATHIGLGRIKRINQLPKINLGMEIEPVKYFSYQTNLSYQYSEYDTEAKLLQFDYDWENNMDIENMKSTVLRQTFHTISIGQKINVKYDISPEVFIGINGGVNFNFVIPGKYKFENPGYNADELFKEFDNYLFRGDTTRNWNGYYGGGDPNNVYEYWYVDQQQEQTVPEDEVMTLEKGRAWISWTAGIDFYYDRLKISPFVEGKITDINFLYRDYFNVGLGITYYLRK